jgi:hypothetical protein
MDKRDQRWLDWYELAARYRSERGDLLVPRDYSAPGGRRLGRWIERQRAAYHGEGTCRLDAERIRMLEDLGMVWKLETRTAWDIWLSLCERYAKQFGNLRVPKAAVCEGMALGEWLCIQKKRRRAGKLSPEQIARLDALGIRWTACGRHPWQDWYALAKDYRAVHGNLKVPVGYETADGRKLGRWICAQRDRYYAALSPWKRRSAGPPLQAAQIALLDEIGMNWKRYRARKAPSSLPGRSAAERPGGAGNGERRQHEHHSGNTAP